MLPQRVGLVGDSGLFGLPRDVELGEASGVSTSAMPSSYMSCTPPAPGGWKPADGPALNPPYTLMSSNKVSEIVLIGKTLLFVQKGIFFAICFGTVTRCRSSLDQNCLLTHHFSPPFPSWGCAFV